MSRRPRPRPPQRPRPTWPAQWPLFLAAALALMGCDVPVDQWAANPNHVGVYRDAARGVTCWIAGSGRGIAISCLPDSALKDGGAP